MAGGILRYLTERKSEDNKLKIKRGNGVLFSSGLIAGSALVGVGLALFASYSKTFIDTFQVGYEWMGPFDSIASLIIFGGLAMLLWSFINKIPEKT